MNRSGYYTDCSINRNEKFTEQYRKGGGKPENKATFLGERDEGKSHCSQPTQLHLIPCHDDLLCKQDSCFSSNRNTITSHKSTSEHLSWLSLVARTAKLTTSLPSDTNPTQSLQQWLSSTANSQRHTFMYSNFKKQYGMSFQTLTHNYFFAQTPL